MSGEALLEQEVGEGQSIAAALVRRGSRPRPSVAGVAETERAVNKWIVALKKVHESGALVVKPGESLWLFSRDALETRATATLEKRAGSILQYVVWAARRRMVAFPLSEEAVQEYLRESAALPAISGSSFLVALAFMGHVFRVDVDHVMTPRSRGLACARGRRSRRLLCL